MDEVNGQAQRPRHTLPGIYRHYRDGHLYEVWAVLEDSNNAVLPPNMAYVVAYQSRQLEGADIGLAKRFRSEAEFHEWVCTEPGPFEGVCRSPWGEEQMAELLEHGFVPRFEYLGEQFEPWMEKPKPLFPPVGTLIYNPFDHVVRYRSEDGLEELTIQADDDVTVDIDTGKPKLVSRRVYL